MAEGSYLLTINPGTLDDERLWSYADLQRLCKSLSLSGKGKRADLELRLAQWHKTRTAEGFCASAGAGTDETENGDNRREDYFPLNVDGSNFSIFSMNVKPRSPIGITGSSSSSSSSSSSISSACLASPAGIKKVGSLLGLDENSPTMVSPTLLRPLGVVTTPNKSILRTSGSKRKSSEIKFSPFNGTKVIPNRRQSPATACCEGDYMHRMAHGPDEDEDDEDDDGAETGYVDDTARINAEKNVNLCGPGDGRWDNSF